MLTRRRFLQTTALAGAALFVSFRLEDRAAAARGEKFRKAQR